MKKGLRLSLLSIFMALQANLVFAQVPNYIPSNGLVGYWPFSGNANDVSGNGNNGTVNGSTLTADRFGNANSAYSFDGVNDYIQSSNQSLTGSVSFSGWYKMPTYNINTLGANDFAFMSNHSGLNNSSRNIVVGFRNFGTEYGHSTYLFDNSQVLYGNYPINQIPTANIWHHFVSVFENGQFVKMYLDGNLFYTNLSVPNNSNSTSLPLFFGIGVTQQFNFYNGQLDDIGIWNRALTPAEITGIYNTTPIGPTVSIAATPSTASCPGTPVTLTANTTSGASTCTATSLPSNLQTGLVGFWPFCGNANDASGNGNNGTVNGATLTADRFGNANSAYSFDGSDDHIALQANNLPTSTRSVSVWFYSTTIGVGAAGRSVLGYGGQSCGQSWNMHLDNAGSPNGANSYEVNTHCNVFSVTSSYGSNVPNSAWHNWVAITSSAGTHFYLDGALISTNSAFINNTYVLGKDFFIGAYPNTNGIGASLVDPNNTTWNGKLDDIGIWNRALTASEIQQLYTQGQATYAWSPGGATTASITVSPTATTTYSCTVTANSLSTTSSTIVTVLPAPTITATSASICAGNGTTLTAAAGSTSTPNTCANLSGSLATGLVGYWPFCGNANDVSGNGNNGTVNGAMLTTDRFGNANSAYSFNGVSSTISCVSQGVPTSASFSVSFWVKPTSVAGIQEFFSQNFWPGAFYIGLNNGIMRCGDSWQNTGVSVIANQWQNFTIIRTFQSNVKIYLNGTLVATLPNDISINNTLDPILFGKQYGSNGEYYLGVLDDFISWNRALTTTEIQQLYTQGQTTYAWSPGGATTPSITVSPTSTTTYTCTVTDANGACSSTQTITVNALPNVNAGIDQNVCAGTSATLNATGASTYSWTGGVQNGTAFTPTSSATYTVTGTSAAGCTSQDDIFVTVNPLPSAVVTQNGASSFCPGSSVQLCAPTGTGLTYAWSGNLATTSCITVSSTQTTSVTVTNASGCSATSSPQSVTVFGNPVANAGPDGTITCIQNASGYQIGSTPNATYTYSWSPITGLSNPNIANPIANPSATTTYTLSVVNADGCTGSDQVTVSVNNTPPISNAGLDFTKTCVSNPTGATIGTTAIAGNTYAWTPTNGLSSSTIANPTANPLFNTTYTLTTTNTANGCSLTDQVIVTVNTFQPTANAGLDFITTCISNVNGTNIGSTSVTGNTYAWTPATGLSSATVSNPTANPSATTTYTLTATNISSGCTATDQVLVTVDNQGPTVNAGNDISKTCVSNVNGATIGMTPISGNTYAWTPATGLSSTTIANPFANPTATTTYTVSSTNPTTGCTATDQIIVTVNNTPPTANAGLDATVSCNTNVGGAILGTPTVAGNSYSWTPSTGLNSSTLSQPTANPSTNTTYNLMVMNASSGCMSTDQVDVSVNTTPATANAGLDGSVNCLNNGTGYGLGSTPISGMTYAWTPSTGLSSATVANPLASPTVATVYTLTATNSASGCTANDQVTVFINTQVPSVDAGLNQIICAGTPVTLTGNGSAGATFQWDNGIQNGVTFVPTTTTTYTLTATAANGCSSTDQVIVAVNILPTVSAGPDVQSCNGSPVTLAGTGALTYTWQPAIQNGQAFIPVNSSAFIVTGTDANNCQSTDTVQVTVGQATSSTLNESACDSYTLNGQSYTQSGTYTQVMTNASGCDSTITLNLNLEFSPITPVITVTNGVTMTVDAQANANLQWINCSDLTPIAGATGATFTASVNGVYAVVASNACGSDTSECSTVNSVGLETLSSNGISIFPNPTNELLTVQVPVAFLGSEWNLVDIRGRQVLNGQVDIEQFQLNLSDLARGTYWLSLGTNQPIQVVKN